MTCGIYRILNVKSGKFYLGSSKNIEHRWKGHLRDLEAGNHHNVLLQRAYAKYGRDAFSFEVIVECPEKDRLRIEQSYLNNAWGSGALYNLCPLVGRLPSSLGKKRSAEALEKFKATIASRTAEQRAATAEKMRRSIAAIPAAEKIERYQRVAEKVKATKAAKPKQEQSASYLKMWAERTAEERARIAAKISRRTKGKKRSPEAIEKNRAKGLGTKHSEETRRKMSESHTGMKMSQECLDKRKAAWAKKSPEELAEIRARMWATRKANKAARK